MSFTQLLYAIKIMKSLFPLILISLIIGCANEQKKNELEASNNNMALKISSLDSTAQYDLNLSKEIPKNLDKNRGF